MAETIKSVVLTADGVANAVPCYFWGAVADATGAVTIYDNASAASGTKLLVLGGPQAVMYSNPVKCANGIYVDLTANNVTVFYSD